MGRFPVTCPDATRCWIFVFTITIDRHNLPRNEWHGETDCTAFGIQSSEWVASFCRRYSNRSQNVASGIQQSYQHDPKRVGITDQFVGSRLDLQRPGLEFAEQSTAGTYPSELGMLSNLGRLWFQNNFLIGEIPLELQLLAMNNGSLMDLDVTGSAQLSGTILDEVCGMESLQFGCSSILCGCNYTCGA